jgi:hypothetical protein
MLRQGETELAARVREALSAYRFDQSFAVGSGLS